MRRKLEAEILALKREVVERGGHEWTCGASPGPCTCGWQARREELEAEIKKGE